LGGTLEVNHRFITLPIGNYENGPDVVTSGLKTSQNHRFKTSHA
jgi:hypothetical protein